MYPYKASNDDWVGFITDPMEIREGLLLGVCALKSGINYLTANKKESFELFNIEVINIGIVSDVRYLEIKPYNDKYLGLTTIFRLGDEAYTASFNPEIDSLSKKCRVKAGYVEETPFAKYLFKDDGSWVGFYSTGISYPLRELTRIIINPKKGIPIVLRGEGYCKSDIHQFFEDEYAVGNIVDYSLETCRVRVLMDSGNFKDIKVHPSLMG